ncbi:hypothetical protein BCR44DRAFT_167001 [Catenaria anguillulae PL171]|uniref:Uncharacterized protein n=1 Tax=Catenaria anguillulae PL171 TaxID=765915 RepID=A0A1Y2HCF2_9FUNG|nr:hypothetical protein BCR44DRAFT_167001 [Catenaria anguillulae PL171]
MILPMFSAGCVLSGAWNFRSAPQCFWPMHMYSLAYLSSLTAIWSDWSHIMQCFNSSCHGILKMNPSITQLLPNPQLAQPVVPIQPTKPFHNSACVHQVAKALCLYSRPRLGPNHRIVYQLRTAAGTQASVFGAGSDMDALASVFPKLMHSRRGPKQLKSHFIPIWEQAKCNFSRLQRQLKRSLFRHCCRGRTVKGQVQSAPNFRVASFLLWATFLVFHRERFWGSGHNCEIVRRIVLSYVRLRKFESLNVADSSGHAFSLRIHNNPARV